MFWLFDNVSGLWLDYLYIMGGLDLGFLLVDDDDDDDEDDDDDDDDDAARTDWRLA